MIAASKYRLADPHLHFSIAIAIVLLVTFVHVLTLPLVVSYDGMQYVHLANVLSAPAVIANWNFYRTPLFPLALNWAFRLGGEQPQSALLVTTLFGLGGVLLAGWTVRRIAGATAGAVALMLMVFYPILVGYQHMLLSETGIFFWLALLVWSLICLPAASKRWTMAVACWMALVLALAYYWRPTLLYLSPVVAVVFLLRTFSSRETKRYSALIAHFRRPEPRIIASVLIILLAPWSLAYPWRWLTAQYMPGGYAGFLAAGMFKQVLVRPSDPVLASVRTEYEAAIQHDSVRGKLPLDGVTIGNHAKLMDDYIRAVSAAGVARMIRRYPVRYAVRVFKSFIFFLGVPDHRVDDENWNFSRAVFDLWPGDENFEQTLGWVPSLTQFAPQHYGGGALVGKFFGGLMPVYTWLVLFCSIVSLGWMLVSLFQADSVGLALTAIPFALLFLHALTLQAADRYAFPVYPLMLANLVVIIRLACTELKRRRRQIEELDASQQSVRSLLSLAEQGKRESG